MAQELKNFTLNRMINPNAQFSIGNAVAFADAAGTSPVDGTGGSPTVTITQTLTSPLEGTASFLFTKDAANRQGQGWSLDLNLQTSDATKTIICSFDYQIASGTYVGAQALPSLSDITMWVYDVTNSVLYQASPNQLDGTANPNNQYSMYYQFQVPANCLVARPIWFIPTTGTSAFTIKFNNLSFGRLNGLVQAAPQPNAVFVSGGAGYGATNTKVRRFSQSDLNVGTAITYTSNSTNGDSFTINEAGVYAITYEETSSTTVIFGITVNWSASLSTYVNNQTYANGARTSNTQAQNGVQSTTSWTGYLNPGDIVRAMSSAGGTPSTNLYEVQFSIQKVA